MIKQVSHLGIAVKDLEESREFYRSVFGLESSEPIIGGDGTIKVSMVEIGHTLIELLQPIGNEGVMAKFLDKRGEGFHQEVERDRHCQGENNTREQLRLIGVAKNQPRKPWPGQKQNRQGRGREYQRCQRRAAQEGSKMPPLPTVFHVTTKGSGQPENGKWGCH